MVFLVKKFNVTGICVNNKHYMVDISEKLSKITTMIDYGDYFTINKGRQYGKTTTLSLLRKELKSKYIVISISFEGLGSAFETEENFCVSFLEMVQLSLERSKISEEYSSMWLDKNVVNFQSLSRHITKMCKDKKVVLLIDEVDKACNYTNFLNFLGILRKKFLDRNDELDYTFQSVVLAGVHDIKNIKSSMVTKGFYEINYGEGKYNSPWNIAEDFLVDMSFNPKEISTMLVEYEKDHNTGMDITNISKEIYNYTSGYPFLVSKICKIIDERLNKDWTLFGIKTAIKLMLKEPNTLFKDIAKTLENDKDLYNFLYDLVIVGEQKTFSTVNNIIEFGVMYGYLDEVNERPVISNRIFELLLVNYFITKDENDKAKKKINGVLYYEVVSNENFNMELCISKFAEHYKEVFDTNNKKDEEFLKKHGRMVFLTYLKPLLNGKGFYHIESQFTDLRRMYIVVDFNKEQFILELKLWKGESLHQKAYKQLLSYMDSKNSNTGYLLTFDFRKEKNKTPKAEWVEIDGKKIFDVII